MQFLPVDSSPTQGLNPEQQRAVDATEGAVLVLAGAGTGKTTVLTTRLAHILKNRLAEPWQTLTVTFTNRAAREMRQRIASLGYDSTLRWLGTFHSISARMLRNHAQAAGFKSSDFTILDKDDQIRLAKQVIEAANLDCKRHPPRYLASLIDSWKNRAITPDSLTLDEAERFASGNGKKLYATYQERLNVLNAADFGDLILRMTILLQNTPDILQQYHDTFRYILVDEYQDTNIAQYMWLRLLAQGNGNICCVGDDDQSIYGWRGAEVGNILRFERDFPGAQTIRLERNYRSTGHILDAASHLISRNTDRLGKTLRCQSHRGEPVHVTGLWDGDAEARSISDRIESWKHSGGRYDQCAVLVRASWQMRAFEERFIMLALPYRVIGGPRFYERSEIRDALAYLRLIRSASDDLAFERIVNQPRRGIGLTTLRKIRERARKDRLPLNDAASSMLADASISGAAAKSVHNFIANITRWRADAEHIEHPRIAEKILDESGYTTMLQNDGSVQAQTRLDNLRELVRVMAEFGSLSAFLEHVALVLDAATDPGNDERVQILTIHGAKGLEWPVVFLPGWEEDVFPSRRSVEEDGARGLQEERRLAHVALTRAREQAHISFVANRQIHGRWQSVMPSRFIDELPDSAVIAVSDTGYHRHPSHSAPPYPASRTTPSHAPESSYRTGQNVTHTLFGTGHITAVDGKRLSILFDSGEEKKIIDHFVSPE